MALYAKNTLPNKQTGNLIENSETLTFYMIFSHTNVVVLYILIDVAV